MGSLKPTPVFNGDMAGTGCQTDIQTCGHHKDAVKTAMFVIFTKSKQEKIQKT